MYPKALFPVRSHRSQGSAGSPRSPVILFSSYVLPSAGDSPHCSCLFFRSVRLPAEQSYSITIPAYNTRNNTHSVTHCRTQLERQSHFAVPQRMFLPLWPFRPYGRWHLLNDSSGPSTAVLDQKYSWNTYPSAAFSGTCMNINASDGTSLR